MRVAVVTETWPPEINGVAHTIGKLVQGLVRQGHSLQLVRPRQRHASGNGQDGIDEILVFGIPIPMYQALRIGVALPGQLLRAWRACPPDIVHIVTEGPLGMAALRAARQLDIPVSSSFHSNFDSYSQHYGYGWLQGVICRHLRQFHNRTQLTLVPTQSLAQSLTQSGYQNVDVLARGVDTTLFSPQRRSLALRVAWGARMDALVVMHVGRLAPEKNLGLVLKTFAAIRRQNAAAILVFVGDGPARKQLQNEHPQHIYAGMHTGEDLATHYASADLFLLSSLTETYGNVTLEALASGLPVVAYDMAAAAEMVRPLHNGCLAPPGDETAFIDAGLTVASNCLRSPHLHEQARLSVANHGWEAIQDRFATKLQNTVRLHGRRHDYVNGLAVVPD